MIAVAEQSNSLETVLTQIADSLERDTWRRLDLFVRLIEPLMLLILAGVVVVACLPAMLAYGQERRQAREPATKSTPTTARTTPERSNSGRARTCDSVAAGRMSSDTVGKSSGGR